MHLETLHSFDVTFSCPHARFHKFSSFFSVSVTFIVFQTEIEGQMSFDVHVSLSVKEAHCTMPRDFLSGCQSDTTRSKKFGACMWKTGPQVTL